MVWLVGEYGSQHQADSRESALGRVYDPEKMLTLLKEGEKYNTKRQNRRLGRVIELYPGKDDIERVVKLPSCSNGFVITLLQRLYPLEMSVSDLPSDIALGENFPESNRLID
ncbi:hypothetical protein TNIN_168131 [Trichonephila inaurata madagascariensis]|uniref:Uncharacterized protein n=1 Tax=Trichonephila inaurata madagascariensis TaxID=2747483 RepID=A0A8X6JIW8_9ARAC|nr:hypothetical protein TNIN_168131 [Trichonephila inaurata madagascariensis]